MKTIFRAAVWPALLVLAVGMAAPVGWAQKTSEPPQNPPAAPGQGQGAQGAPPQVTPANPPPEAPKLDPEEEAAYKAFYDLKGENPQAVITGGEDFLKKYPQSHYAGTVYEKLAAAYQIVGQDEKMFSAGEKAIELNPDNVDALSMMAEAIPRRIHANDLDADQRLQKAEQYAKHALELLDKLQKPAGLTDDQFAKAKTEEAASCHSGLGLVYYYQHNLPQMVTELEQATQSVTNPDPVDLFLLGFAYQQTQRPSEAVGAFTKCAAMTGPMQDRCKQSLDQAKKLAASQPAPKK